MSRAVTWQGVEEWLAEHAQIDLWDGGVAASGVQLGGDLEYADAITMGRALAGRQSL